MCAPRPPGRNDASDAVLHPLVPAFLPPDQVVSQGVRCRQMFDGQRSAIFRQLSDVEKLSVIQAGSAIGRRALSTLPLAPRYTLTGHEMRTAFHVRTLAQPISGLCRKCDQHNYLFHGESCRAGNQAARTNRYEGVKMAIGAGLKSLPGVSVFYEPRISLGRNDIRIVGSAATEQGTEEDYDVTVVSLSSNQAESCESSIRHRRPSRLSPGSGTRHPHSVGGPETRFAPWRCRSKHQVLAAGVHLPGVLWEKGTLKVMEGWRKHMTSWEFDRMSRTIAVSLARSRGINFQA